MEDLLPQQNMSQPLYRQRLQIGARCVLEPKPVQQDEVSFREHICLDLSILPRIGSVHRRFRLLFVSSQFDMLEVYELIISCFEAHRSYLMCLCGTGHMRDYYNYD